MMKLARHLTYLRSNDIIITRNFSMLNRLKVTSEVAVSKLFPGGFGWQALSVLADKSGYAADSLQF